MTVTSNQPKLRVAIIGGGMGGLVLGLCLKKYAHDVRFDIYESAAQLAEVGVGIAMSPHVWPVMCELGLEEELLAITGAKDSAGFGLLYRKCDEGKIVEIAQGTEKFHGFHRSLLQQLLVKHLDAGDRIHLSKRLVSYSESSPTEPITLGFKDGTTETCDLVVGCDGIRSTVRRTMFNSLAEEAEKRGQPDEALRLRSMVDPIWSGMVIYRSLVPPSSLSEDLLQHMRAPQDVFGKNKVIVMYPVSGGKLINIGGTVYTPGADTVYDGPWVKPTTVEEIAKIFDGWDPKTLAVIQCMKEPSCWAAHTVRELPTFVNGRVALTGDAAHAMLQFLGAGAGQAFEDGFVLATILSHPSVTLANLPAALGIYDQVRRPFTQSVQRSSARAGEAKQLRGVGWEDVSAEDSRTGRYAREKLEAVGEELRTQLRWTVETSILDQTAGVVERLKALAA